MTQHPAIKITANGEKVIIQPNAAWRWNTQQYTWNSYQQISEALGIYCPQKAVRKKTLDMNVETIELQGEVITKRLGQLCKQRCSPYSADNVLEIILINQVCEKTQNPISMADIESAMFPENP